MIACKDLAIGKIYFANYDHFDLRKGDYFIVTATASHWDNRFDEVQQIATGLAVIEPYFENDIECYVSDLDYFKFMEVNEPSDELKEKFKQKMGKSYDYFEEMR